MSNIVRLTAMLMGEQGEVTYCNVTHKTDLIENAKRKRDEARAAIHDAVNAKDDVIADLLAACENAMGFVEELERRDIATNWSGKEQLRVAIAKARGAK